MRLSWGGALLAALLVTLTRPGAWAVALAGFLARGGIVPLAVPILVLPTPPGLQNTLGAPIGALLVGASSTAFVLLVAGLVLALAAAVVLGALVGAWAERLGIRGALEAARDEGLVEDRPGPEAAPGTGRIAVLRLLGLAPVAVVALLSVGAVYDAAYRELVLPAELRTPLVVRILAAAPGAFAGMLLAWVIGDAAASLAVRELVLGRRRLLVAWARGWWSLVRHPLRALGTALVTLVVLVACVAPGIAAALVGWERVRVAFLEARDPAGMAVSVVLWVAVWLGALVLAGFGSAFRNAAWTLAGHRPG